MDTLGTMKERIARETTRDDLLDSGAIEEEIRSAIAFYRGYRFWFNEKRSAVTFNTVVGQTDYTSTENANIPNLIRIDGVFATYGSGDITHVSYCDPVTMELLLGNTPVSSSRPYKYSYYEQILRLYPRPDQIYPMRIMAVVRVNAPVNDTEADNPWMIDGEELIRARAKAMLAANSMLGTENSQASVMKSVEAEALERLKMETSSRSQVNRIRPTDF